MIDICLETGAALVAASGEIDLSHDQGRLVARLLTSVAKAETERKGARHREANEQAARAGKRRTGTPRPFGYADDHLTRHPVEAPAVEQGCKALLGGGTLSGVMREWAGAGLVPPQSKTGRWTRTSIRTILLNPRIAGLSVYRGEIVGTGQWEPLVAEETWRAMRAILEDPPASRRAACALCWADSPCARAETLSPACLRIPGITSTGAPRPAATPPIRVGTLRGRPPRSRRSSSAR